MGPTPTGTWTDRARTTAWWRTPPWWATLLVQATGLWGAFFCLVLAVFSLPEVGLFGARNDAGTRLTGAIAALGFGPALLAGPLFIGLVRRDGRWLRAAAAVAAVLSLLLLAGAASA